MKLIMENWKKFLKESEIPKPLGEGCLCADENNQWFHDFLQNSEDKQGEACRGNLQKVCPGDIYYEEVKKDREVNYPRSSDANIPDEETKSGKTKTLNQRLDAMDNLNEANQKFPDGHQGEEGRMHRTKLSQLISDATMLLDLFGDEDDLPEWLESKITLSSDYIHSATSYLAGERSREDGRLSK